MAHILVQDSNLILHAALLALQNLLGDTFDGHQLLSPLIFCQDYLREGPSAERGDSRGGELSFPPASPPSPYGLRDHPQTKEMG